MKIRYPLSKFSTAVLAVALALSGCVAPDMSDCPDRNTRVEVKTWDDPTRADGESIENVYIYVFDGQQRFVTVWAGGAYTPGQTYETWLDLDPGDYYFVAWTNLGGFYDTVAESAPAGGEGTMEQMTLRVNVEPGSTITGDIPDLYYGMLSGATVYPATVNDFTVVIKPNVYRLNFTAEGLAASDSDFVFTVTDNNISYSFGNSILGDQAPVAYARTGELTDGWVETSMRVLKLTDQSSPIFDLSDAAGSVCYYTDDLVQMIKKAYGAGGYTVDFDLTFEFDIKLFFRSRTDVEISVNGWSYNPNDTEL